MPCHLLEIALEILARLRGQVHLRTLDPKTGVMGLLISAVLTSKTCIEECVGLACGESSITSAHAHSLCHRGADCV